jgi:hypothetical protein
MREAANDVEAYQQRMRGSATPLNDQIHREAKRGSRIITGPSEAGSSRSKGSDKASRVSHRTTATNGASNELRLRVDASAPISLQLNGDLEGRAIRFEQAEDGMADIIIANTQGEERTYRSERGSLLGSSRRSAVNRSDRSEELRSRADEQSIRSSRSSQGRREREHERETRPLRRTRELRYN